MFSKCIILGLGLLLFAGCASRPQIELEIVRNEVARAYASGAMTLAPEAYEAASAALNDAETLVYHGNFNHARVVLNIALLNAAKATSLAQEKSAELEEQLHREQLPKETVEKKAKAVVKKRPVAPPVITPEPVKAEVPKPKIVLLDQVRVSVGETLFSLSSRRDIYGEPLLWPLIYKANRDQIKDPQQIFEGQILTIPRDKSEQEKEAARKEGRESDLFPR